MGQQLFQAILYSELEHFRLLQKKNSRKLHFLLCHFMLNMTKKLRCWDTRNPLYIRYHDEEWGVPNHDDRRFYEFLILGGNARYLDINLPIRDIVFTISPIPGQRDSSAAEELRPGFYGISWNPAAILLAPRIRSSSRPEHSGD